MAFRSYPELIKSEAESAYNRLVSAYSADLPDGVKSKLVLAMTELHEVITWAGKMCHAGDIDTGRQRRRGSDSGKFNFFRFVKCRLEYIPLFNFRRFV